MKRLDSNFVVTRERDRAPNAAYLMQERGELARFGITDRGLGVEVVGGAEPLFQIGVDLRG